MSIKQLNLSYSDFQESAFFHWPTGIKYKTWKKGRRVGATRGASTSFIEKLHTPNSKLLWGDTVLGNIQKYFERYFEPTLKENNVKYKWSTQEKKLVIGSSYCDFRSSDQPENWEGFGYQFIFLNEAGIILKNKDLYLKSVMPMLLDFKDSKLLAAGVPKGKRIKTGENHLFYDLHQRALSEPDKYLTLTTTSYDSPFLDEADVKALESEMYAIGGMPLVQQEIYGEFVDGIKGNIFIIHFDKEKHVSHEAKLDIGKQLFLSIDFNLTPFGLTASHIWEDRDGHHFHIVDEMQINNGSIPEMIDAIKSRYYPWLQMLVITGDHQGTKGELSQRDNASYYQQIRRGLNLSQSQIKTPSNPTHENSRADCNYVFARHPDIKINPKCTNTIFDIENVEVDNYGSIIKKNRTIKAQQADLIDTVRYKVNTFLKDWIKYHQKINQR